MSTPVPPAVRTGKLINLAGVRTKPVSWLLEEKIGRRVPKGALSIIGGKPGTGKSQWAIAVAAELTKLGDRVLFIGSEDGLQDTVRPRLLAAGAIADNFSALVVNVPDGEDQIWLPDDIVLIRHALMETGAALMIVDPIGGHISPEINAHSDQSLRRALIPLAKLTRERNVATLAVMHQRKATEGAALDSLNGGTAFGGVARSVMLFCRHKDDDDYDPRRVLVHVKCNSAPLADPWVTSVTGVTVEDGGVTVQSSRVSIDGREDPSIQMKELR